MDRTERSRYTPLYCTLPHRGIIRGLEEMSSRYVSVRKNIMTYFHHYHYHDIITFYNKYMGFTFLPDQSAKVEILPDIVRQTSDYPHH